MYKLISIPQVDISLLPLELTAPDGINNGGYKIPEFYGNILPRTKHMYSPIDLLVAGLEAMRRDIIVTSLVSFFDKNRDGYASESEVYVNLLQKEKLVYTIVSIAWIKKICIEDSNLKSIFKKNAPLTFKWVG